MASLNETGSVVANSLEVVNNEGVGNQDNQPSDQPGEQWINGDNQERPVIQKDLNILYDILERVEHKLDKISDIESRLVKIEVYKLTQLLSTGNVKELCNVGKFIKFAFKERKTM